MKQMLIVDDNKQITSVLEQYAKKEGYACDVAFDGVEGLANFQKKDYDIVLLDVMMPRLDGFQLCRRIRETSQVPVLMITARGEDYERILGLDIGADDYIVKPFSPGEVMARVRAIMRRLSPQKEEKNIVIDNLEINLSDYIVKIDGKPLSLTKKEIEILYTLCHTRGKVFSRDQLLDSIWGMDYFGDSRTVDSHVKRLRAKLDKESHPAWDIATIWGVGYKFEVKNHV